jgi:hypothetical protein
VGGTGTNLISGWTNSAIVTNLSLAWSSATNGWYTNTTYYTNSAVQYADFKALWSDNVPLQFRFNSNSNALVKPLKYLVAKSVDGVNYDLVNISWLSFAHNNDTEVTGVTNYPMGAFAYGRIIQVTNDGNGITATTTNLGVYYGIKRVP